MDNGRSIYRKLDRWLRGLPPVKFGAVMTIIFLFSWIGVSVLFGSDMGTLVAGILGSIGFGGTAAFLQERAQIR